MIAKSKDSKKFSLKRYLRHFTSGFVAIILLASSGMTTTLAAEPAAEKSQVPGNCSRLYAAVEKRPFRIPQGSWFWKEARNYLASMGLPHDNYHIKMFEEAFTEVYSKIENENLDHQAIYDMTPVFQKPGVGDIAFDYCSSS